MTALKDVTTGIGVISYNGFTFPAIRNVKVSVTPHYDEANRLRTYNVFTFVVDATVWAANETTQSTGFDSLYKLLSANGGALTISGCGVGTFNVSGTDSDVAWGPRPKLIDIRPIAGFISAEITWVVEVALPTCQQHADYSKLLEFNFSIAYAIDERGLTTRTVSGYARIPQTKVSSTSSVVTRTADSWRETILGLIIQPLGFSRSSSWVDGPDRSRLDFTVVDKQLDTDDPLPPGIIPNGIDASWSLDNSAAVQFQNWKLSFTGTAEHAAGYPRDWGWQILYLMIASKVASLAAPGRSIVPEHLRVTRQFFKRTTNVSVSFKLIDEDLSQNVLNSGGLWQPVPGSDWTQWRTSLNQHFGARGVAGLSNSMPSGDALVSLCDAPVQSVSIGGGSSTLTAGGSGGTSTLFGCPPVTQKNSYLHFDNYLKASRQQSYSHQKSVQEFDPTATQLVGYQGLPTEGGMKMGQPFNGTPDTLQFQSVPTDRICMEGTCVRLAFEPAIPGLILADGRTPIEVDRQVMIKQVGSLGSCKLYGAAWRISYELPGGVGGSALVAQPSPILG